MISFTSCTHTHIRILNIPREVYQITKTEIQLNSIGKLTQIYRNRLVLAEVVQKRVKRQQQQQLKKGEKHTND